jgi:hypothetical protein
MPGSPSGLMTLSSRTEIQGFSYTRVEPSVRHGFSAA